MALPASANQRGLPLLVDRDGTFTRELHLVPGELGLGLVPENRCPDATTAMVCGFCSTGCSLDVHLRDGEAVGLTPTPGYPVNRGMACPKGWESLAVLDAPDRATRPLLRDLNGRLSPVNWDQALRTFTERMKAIQQAHGPEAIAFLSTGQIVTEEMAMLGALAKFGMGMLHGDGNTRQCMATAVVAYQEAFGFDAPPYTYADFEQSDVIVLVGSNLCIAHPIMWQRIVNNPHRPEIIVIDPRATETAMQATQHLALKPKSDLVLFYGLAHLFIERGWIDLQFIDVHTTGFLDFATFLQPFTLDRVCSETGMSPDTIDKLAQTIHAGDRVSFWWTMGVNQSHQGVRTAQAIINLALMTGNIGRPGTGANSITGQCNAMGSRLFSNTTNLLGGHDFGNPSHRRKIADSLGIAESDIPTEKGWPYHKILEGVLSGKIRGLWVIGTNPAHSWINQGQLRDVLDRLDFLVVQDMYASTDTAQLADLVLPAAAWGEKDGTFINSERRIGVVKKVKRAPGMALADFAIFRLIAEYWGCGTMFREWDSPEAVFQILKRLSAGQPCDFTGIKDFGMLDERRGIQWPYRLHGDCQQSERRLFEDGRFFHADGKARFIWSEPRPLPEALDAQYPLLLLTGRGSTAQWHTQTRTAKSQVLKKLYPADIYVELNPRDASELKIRPGDWVTVSSQRGSLQAKAVIVHTIPPRQVFVPMHYAVTNLLTDAVFDPYSFQPAYKACAVRVDRRTLGDAPH
ncbi:MAG TPA: nitrate reductase [Pirellulales bacterium]|nr:nitrate reductase [Pirellulales bacterium]